MITVRKVRKCFLGGGSEVRALRDVDLEVKDKEFFVLLGPSGSGKTTLLRCVAGLDIPDAGEILLGQAVVFSSYRGVFVAPEHRRLGMVFQSYAVWPHMTVFENVAFPLTHGVTRLPKPRVSERVRRALALVQLEGFETRPTPLLSGGQQQRVALARALAVEPDVLLMDEPLSNLDARLREEVRSQIREVSKHVGVTVLYVTHDQQEAMTLADRVGVIAGGEILQIGSATELYDRPIDPKVADFFGSINWLDGRVLEPGRVDTDVGVICTANQNGRGSVRLGIRPENVRLSGVPEGETNIFLATVVDEICLGDQRLIKVEVNSHLLLAKIGRDSRKKALDKRIYVHFEKDDVLVFPEGMKL